VASAQVLGIDIGGSGTRAVLCGVDGTVVRVGTGPTAQHQVVGHDGTRTAVAATLEGWDLGGVVATHVGASGADFPEDLVALADDLAHLPGLVVENDAVLGLHAATEGFGVAVVAGSGTNAVAVGRDRSTHQVGGLGWHCGDVGGAWQLGVDGLRQAIRAWEGREPASTLTARCCELAGLADGAALLHAVARFAGPDALKVASIVIEEAGAGDAVADALCRAYGAEMGCAAGLALTGAGLADEDDVAVVVIGGLVAQSLAARTAPLLDALIAAARLRAPGARLLPWDGSPVVGAVAAALRRVGVPADVATLSAQVDT
jgi:N-acetylglucosamine kinase-like BadF-type ATPase